MTIEHARMCQDEARIRNLMLGIGGTVGRSIEAVVTAMTTPDILVRVTMDKPEHFNAVAQITRLLIDNDVLDNEATKAYANIDQWPAAVLKNGSAIEFVIDGRKAKP